MTTPSAPPPSYESVADPYPPTQPEVFRKYEGTAYSSVPTECTDQQGGGYGTGAPMQGYSNPQNIGFAQPVNAGYPAPNTTVIPPQPARTNYQPEAAAYDDGQPKPDTHVMMADSEWAGNSFSDKAIRRAFIRKVYLILVCQLLVTVGFICFFIFHAPTNYWVKHNNWFYWCSYGVFLVTYITLVCCPGVRRTWPINFIALFIFTVAFSYMTATISSYYDTKIVLIAGGITTAVCLSISLFAIQTKVDFTLCSGLLFAGSMVLFFFGITCMIVFFTWGPSYILTCVYGALAALLFSLFLAYDTQMLVGGRKHELSPEEHIFGALQLYLDIVYIFIIILSFFGGKN